MKKTLRVFVTMLLVLTMLFGVLSTTIAAATEGLEPQSGGTVGSSTPSVGGTVTTGWLNVSYDENGVVIIITPEVESLLETTKDDLKAVLNLMIDAAKDLIIDDLKNSILGGDFSEEGSLDGVDKDTLITKAIDGFLDKKYGESVSDPYIQFFKDAVKDDTDALIKEFIDYACDLLRAAVSLGAVSVDDLPTASEIETKFTEKVDSEINAQIDAKVTEYVDVYFAWITEGDIDSAPAIDADVKALIDSQVDAYVRAVVERYINAGFKAPTDASTVDNLVADYINSEIKTFVDGCIKDYANGISTSQKITDLINEEIDAWVSEIASLYPQVPSNNPIYSAISGKIDGALNDKIDEYVDAFFADTLASSNSDIEAAIQAEIDERKASILTDIYEEYWTVKVSSGAKPAWYPSVDDKVFEAASAKATESSTTLDRTEFDAMSYDDVIALLGEGFDSEALEDVKALTPTKAEWKSIWDGLSNQDEIKAEIKLSAAIVSKTQDIINEHWADGSKRQEAIEYVVNSSEYEGLLDKVIFDAEANAAYSSVIRDEIYALLDDASGSIVIKTLRDILDDVATDADKYAALKLQIENEVKEKASSDDVLDIAYDTYFELTKAEVDEKLDGYVALFSTEYSATVADLKANPPSVKYTDLLQYIQGITVNGSKIYDNAQFSVDAVKALIKDVVPTLSELETMPDEQMQRTLKFFVETDFADFNFNITVKLGGGYDKVRRLAQILNKYVSISVNGSSITVDVTVPEKFAELVLRAANSDRVPDELKKKVFKALSATPDDFYAIVDDITFNDLLKVFDYVDVEGLLDHEFLAQFEKLDGLTEEQIKNKLKQYEGYINKILDYARSFYNNKIPDRIKDNNLSYFYEGDGTFAYAGTHTVNIESVLMQFSEKYAALVASFFDSTTVTASVDLSVKFEKINSVEFVLEGTTVREGYLPAGADLNYFAGVLTDSKGYPIISWNDKADGTGNEYVKMPDSDIKLYAIADELTVTVSAASGAPNTLTANVEYDSMTSAAQLTYQWYKIDAQNVTTAVSGATASTYTVSTAADSGYYYCVVTITDGALTDTVESNRIEVNIEKTEIDLADAITWDYTGPLTFKPSGNDDFLGQTQTVTPTVKPEYAGIISLVGTVSGNTGSNAGSYTASATYEIAEGSDYVFKNNVATVTLDWEITPVKYYASSIVWNYTSPFEYSFVESTARALGSATVHKVELTEVPYGLEVSYTGNEKSDAGTYTAVATITSADGNTNYVYAEASNTVSIDWTVNPKSIALKDYAWSFDASNPLVYTGTEQSVVLVGLPSDIVVNYTNNTATDAFSTHLTATAEIDETLAANKNYTFDRTDFVNSCEWWIEKQHKDLGTITWSYIPGTTVWEYEYGVEKKVELVGLPAGAQVATGGTWKATDAGTYTATATVTLDEGNYISTGTVAPLTWTIAPKDILESDIKLSDDLVYNKSTQTALVIGGLYPDLEGSYQLTSNTGKNAGTYTATIALSANSNYTYGGNATAEWNIAWSIAKAPIDLSTFTWNYTSPFTYDKALHGVELNDLGEIVVIYTDSSATNAGTYTATAVIDTENAANDNYVFSGSIPSCEWKIAKMTIDLSAIEWNYTGPFTFSEGVSHTVSLKDIGDLVFIITGNSQSNAGTYTATALIDGEAVANQNYVFVGEVAQLTWTINPMNVSLGTLSWSYTAPFVYSGAAFEVYLVDAEGERVEFVTYTGNTATNAGEYDATAALVNSGNYAYSGEFPQNLSWKINKAVYDMSAVTFNNVTVVYDGNAHTITVTGTLPDGVTVQYSGGDKTAIGTYTVTATFTGDAANYEPIAPMSATLKIEEPPVLKNQFEIFIGDTLIVKINAANGLPEDFATKAIDVTSLYSIFRDAKIFGDNKYGKVVVAYDITFSDTGEIQEVSDAFTVEMLIPESLRGKENVKLLYVAPDGSIQELEMTVVGDMARFETTHFSVYALVEVCNDANLTWLWIVIAILLLVILALVILLLIKNKKSKSDNKTVEAPTEETALVEEAPVEETPIEEAPIEEAPVEEAPAEEAPVEEAPVEEAPVEEAPVEEAPAEEAPVEEAPVEEAPVEEVPVEEAPAEEAPVEEAPVEEAPVEEAPIEEAPVEEAPVEEAPAEEAAPAKTEVVVPIAAVAETSKDEGIRVIGGKEVHVRYRSSFMSRLIQAETSIQDYYTIIKNKLLSYKGVKARTSWNFESFNKGREQCAKLNVKGKYLLVYLNLKPEEYNANKYHFVDVSDKPKLDKVPMMLKVKSERSVKYVLELIEAMMAELNITAAATHKEVDYHMPYETTEALAARDLVKVILPPGVTLDEDSNIVKVDVGELIEAANAEADTKDDAEEAVVEAAPAEEAPAPEAPVEEAPVEEAPVEEAPVEEAPVEEAPVEEAPVEEAPVEEAPVEEAPVEEAPVEEAPVEEAPVEEAPVEEAPIEEAPTVEEPIHTDAIHADALVSDEVAEAQIEVVEKDAAERALGNKLYIVNLDTLCDIFDDGAVITLKELKAKNLIPKKAGRVKILARGVMTKAFTIYADKFSLQAVKMITLAGGHAEQYK